MGPQKNNNEPLESWSAVRSNNTGPDNILDNIYRIRNLSMNNYSGVTSF